MAVIVETEQVTEIFAGEMGVKTIFSGSTEIYSRPGGYIYLELETINEREV